MVGTEIASAGTFTEISIKFPTLAAVIHEGCMVGVTVTNVTALGAEYRMIVKPLLSHKIGF